MTKTDLTTIQSHSPDDPEGLDFGFESVFPAGTKFPGSQGVANDTFYTDVNSMLDYSPAGEELCTTIATGWDLIAMRLHKQGKLQRITRTLAKSMMSYTFESNDPKALEFWKKESKRLFFKHTTVEMAVDWNEYGRCFTEPIWAVRNAQTGKGKRKLMGLVRLEPATIKIFRNNAKDVMDLKEALKEKWIPSFYEAYIAKCKAGSGSTIIGYVQHWQNRAERGSVFFLPSELIYIPRHTDYDAKNGVSIYRENYLNSMSKLKLERGEAIMGSRFVDPLIKFFIPEKWWSKRRKLVEEIKAGIKAGLNIFMPIGMDAKALETQGTPDGVLKAQEHIEAELIAGMGFADSFTSSNSSNRSVGDIQLAFFERDLDDDRDLFATKLQIELIEPYLEEWGFKGAEIDFKFTDLTPQDQVENKKLLIPLVPFMTQTQAVKFFKDVGYPVGVGEEKELMEKLKLFIPPRQDKTAAAAPKSGKTKAKQNIAEKLSATTKIFQTRDEPLDAKDSDIWIIEDE